MEMDIEMAMRHISRNQSFPTEPANPRTSTSTNESRATEPEVLPPPLQELTQAQIEEKEWKYTGYRQYSRFIASDNDFLVFRRFGVLNARVCLALQDEITVLEEELAALDKASSDPNAPDLHNGSFRADVESERSQLLRNKIYSKLKDYNEFMFHYSQLKSKPRVPNKDVNSISNWLENHLNAIQEEEAAYIGHTSDLFSVVPKPKSPLRNLFEKSIHFRIFQPWRVERTDIELGSHDSKHELYMSDEKIDGFVSVIIACVGLAMLIAPLWILEYTKSAVGSLAWITGFIILFLCLVTYATVAKPFETLGATAAYSAVLMVFLQIGK